MQSTEAVQGEYRQRGAALIVCLIFLIALTLIGINAVATSAMGLRMASNTEEELNAFQTAQSAVDAVISDEDNLPTTGPLETPVSVVLPGAAFYAAAGETITASAARTSECGLPPRLARGSSLRKFSSYGYRVASDVDRIATGRGRSSVRLGYLTLGPKC